MEQSKRVINLATEYPELLKEWDYEKNGNLLPSMVTPKSHHVVWWRCEKGHSWKTRVSNRTSKKEGCPFCSNKKVLAGYNDIVTTHPELLKIWDYEKNTVKPTEISFGYRKKLWWKCEKGHSYEGYLYNRRNGHGCPICTNMKIVKGINDFATFYPELLKEWDYEKNDISPEEVGCYSGKKVWWKCPVCGYSWKTAIVKRTAYNQGCVVCKGLKILAGYNDLATLRPDIAARWDYDKNGDLLPTQVGIGSSKKAWFTCSEGHSFQTFIGSYVMAVNKCPVCYHLNAKYKSEKTIGNKRYRIKQTPIIKEKE